MLRVLAVSTLAFAVLGAARGGSPLGKAGEFTLKDVNGVSHSLSDYRESKAIVLMFVGTRCPVSNSYNGRMNDLYADYTPKHVTFLGINSNRSEDVAEMKKHAEEKGFHFTLLKDQGGAVADRFGATVTPEIFVLSPALDILYHGRIDNSGRVERVTSSDLRHALDEILAGKQVSVISTKAFGCTIQKGE